jgi:carboxymethylenebutenolidase
MNTTRALSWVLVGLAVVAAGCGTSEPPSPEAIVAATAAEHQHDAPTPTPAATAEPRVPVLVQELAYGEGARSNLVGYLAMPQDAAEPLPGVIVIHEWWGLNENIKAMTRRLAGEGYVALAVDLRKR